MTASLFELFSRTANAFPDRIALITESSQMSFQDVLDLVGVLDMQLQTRGVREGDVVVLSTSRAEMVIAFALLLSKRSISVIFSPVERAMAAGIDFDRIVSTKAHPDLPEDKQIIISPEWFTLMGAVPDLGAQSNDGNGSFVFSTSGTTGNPRFVSFPEASRLHDLLAMRTIPEDDLQRIRFMTTAGANTGLAMNNNLSVLLAGGSVVALDKDSSKALQFANLWRVSHLMTMPAVIQQALQMPNATQYLSTLEEIEIGGAHTPDPLLAELSTVTRASIVTSFGATETGALFRRPAKSDTPRQMGEIGRLFRNDVDVVFLDETLTEHPDASEGIMGIRLPADAPRAYLGEDQFQGGTGFKDGVFVSGDWGKRDGETYFVTGRMKRVLNLNGSKFSLDEIHFWLGTHLPEGAELAVAATKDPHGMEQLEIFVANAKDVSRGDLDRALSKRWQYLSIGQYHEIEKMPLTDSGKIDFRALTQMA